MFRVEAILTLVVTSCLLQACSDAPVPAAPAQPLVLETKLCLYKSVGYSPGARKQTEMIATTENGEMTAVEDPDGIWMTCTINANGFPEWVADRN